MNTFRRLAPWLALALIAFFVWKILPDQPLVIRGNRSDSSESKNVRQRGIIIENHDSEKNFIDSVDADRLIQRSLERLESPPGSDDPSAILRSLRDGIRAAEPGVAAMAIVDFLMSGRDAATRLPFVVGSGGTMESVPTLRTALLDLLPSLDPEIALEVARGVMNAEQSPDEYALALRNLAWSNFGDDLKNELASRLNQMISLKDWREHPSAGFLEGLDAAVEIADANTFGAMLRLNATAENGALARASFMVLDRMVVRDTSLLEQSFETDVGLSGIAPERRASLMSRLESNSENQRKLLVDYLANPDLGENESDYFAELFPNGNHLHGNWLITSSEPSRSIASRLEGDRRILAGIEGILAGNPPAQVSKALVRIQTRLQGSMPKE